MKRYIRLLLRPAIPYHLLNDGYQKGTGTQFPRLSFEESPMAFNKLTQKPILYMTVRVCIRLYGCVRVCGCVSLGKGGEEQGGGGRTGMTLPASQW